MAPLVILGCGYVGARLARAGISAGRVVRACRRSTGKLGALAELGVETKYVDAATPKSFTAAMTGMAGAVVVYSIPPGPGLAPGHALRAAMQAAYGVKASCFVYFSSSGLYGAQPDDDAWIDEATPVANDDPPMANILIDENEIAACRFELRTVILRLAPVYGPGRGVRERLLQNTYKILDDGEHAISRIHVDDVVRVVFAAEHHAPSGARYLVADDEPTTQGDYARWLCERMAIAMPPSRRMLEPGAPRVAHRNRRIRNAQLKTALGLELHYPTFREGEAAIESEQRVA